MSHNSPKQHTLWLLTALTAPLAHFSGCGWLMAAVTAAAILPLTLIPKSWEGMAKPLALAELLWLGASAGILLQNSAVYWPSDNNWVVPLTLLTLAAVTASVSAPRIGAVLALCMALTAVPLALSGAAHLEPDWLKPTASPWPAALTWVLLLPNLPAGGERGKGRRVFLLGALTAALALLIQGTISPRVASSVPDPFYQTARTLGHLEPVAAAGVTLGWYALAVLLIESGRRIAGTSGIGPKTASVLLLGTATGCVLFLQNQNGWFWTVLSTFLWVLIPFLHKIKIDTKSEK